MRASPGTPVLERVLRRIEIDPEVAWRGDPCWLWPGATIPLGYGYLGVNHQHRYVHRITYEHLVGPVPAGHELDHRCRRTACCNPDHLEAVTHAENCRRGASPSAANARKTECPKCGGPFVVESRGFRVCKPCAAAYSRARRETYAYP